MTGELLQVPKHLGLILDGNRRWARTESLPDMEGHRLGYENFKTIGRAALQSGIEYVSGYVFSTENWTRSDNEVHYLMDLVQEIMETGLEDLHQEGVKIKILGDLTDDRLSNKIVQSIKNIEDRTMHNQNGTLGLCFNYGYRREIADAVRAMISAGLSTQDINDTTIDQYLYQPDFPEMDLLIRTGNQKRLSGFMLPRTGYAEIIFSEKMWPEYSENDLTSDLIEYRNRQRRFGGDHQQAV